MGERTDITDKLVHFTSGKDFEEASGRLRLIIDERRLSGGGEKIRGGYRCVCFTEAPLTSLPHGLVNPRAYSLYSPFGILFEKKWIFDKGGRPVIYQPDVEFDLLPESIRWRHVRYEPDTIDFTWEREWRIKCDYLDFTPEVACIVVPSKEWADWLVAEHDAEQDFLVLQYSQVLDEQLAEQYREEFGWRISVLS